MRFRGFVGDYNAPAARQVTQNVGRAGSQERKSRGTQEHGAERFRERAQPKTKRALDLAAEKGSSVCLTVIPLREIGFNQSSVMLSIYAMTDHFIILNSLHVSMPGSLYDVNIGTLMCVHSNVTGLSLSSLLQRCQSTVLTQYCCCHRCAIPPWYYRLRRDLQTKRIHHSTTYKLAERPGN